MASKREREYARRRYEKANVRLARAAKLRRERRIVAAVTVVAFAAASVVLVLVNRGADAPDEAATTDPATTTAAQAPLPTTAPKLYETPPPASDSLDADWDVTLTTSAGDVTMVLRGADAPQAVASFVFLAQDGFYDGTACHRLLPSSLLQCGDPTATGQGGPGYTFGPIENAPEDGVYPAGTVAMARPANDAEGMGSQFFLVFADVDLPADSAGGYSVFGEITGGLDILQEIGANGNGDGERPATDVVITDVEVEAA